MNLTLPAGASLFTIIHAAGQGPRNPRALWELGNVGEKRPRMRNAKNCSRRPNRKAPEMRAEPVSSRKEGSTGRLLARRHRCAALEFNRKMAERKLALRQKPKKAMNAFQYGAS